MANFTPDYLSNSIYDGRQAQQSVDRSTPKRSTLNFLKAYSKSLEFVKTKQENPRIIAEVNLN